ncbi:MAG: 2-C-methyl-D-erythritol 4-phosphate cytidylyltransferase [Dehalococcoidia bacterium]
MDTHTPPLGRVAAIIVSAGGSTRMAGVDKTLAPLAGIPLIARTVEVFERSPFIGGIVLMVSQENVDPVARLCRERGWKKVDHILAGGARRQDTVRLGLEALSHQCEWVLVHDGARPLLSEQEIQHGLAVAQETGAAIAAVPAKDTVKVVDMHQMVERTLDRSRLVQVQTPQIFRRDLLERAHREITEDVTDDAAMLECLGIPVRVFPGAYANIKVTTPEDLAVAEALLAQRRQAP